MGHCIWIQLKGEDHPGNWGGPTVNSLGEVVGVSASGIGGTQINFAIPVTKLHELVRGQVDEFQAGELFRKGDEVRVPLKCTCIDPIKNVREIRVEIWAGKPPDNPSILPKPAPAKDPERKSFILKDEKGAWSGDVLLPKLNEGQVAWVRPVLVFEKGEPIVSRARTFDAGLAIERRPAELVVKLPDTQERTVHLKAAFSKSQGNENVFSRSGELDVLELLTTDSEGAIIRTGFDSLSLSEQQGDADPISPETGKLLPTVAPAYTVDTSNRLCKKINARPEQKLTSAQDYALAALASAHYSCVRINQSSASQQTLTVLRSMGNQFAMECDARRFGELGDNPHRIDMHIRWPPHAFRPTGSSRFLCGAHGL